MPAVSVESIKGKPLSWSDYLFIAKAPETPISSKLQAAAGKAIDQTTHGYKVKLKRLGAKSGRSDGEPAKQTNGKDAEEEVFARIGAWGEPFGVGDIAAQIGSTAATASKAAGANAGTNASILQVVAADTLTGIKEGIEIEVLSDQEGQADRGPGNGFKFRGLGKWINNSAQADFPVPSAVRTPTSQIYSGTLTDFNETIFVGLMQTRWSNNGTMSRLFGAFAAALQAKMDDFHSKVPTVANFTDQRSFNSNQTDTISKMVTFYKTTWGEAEFHPVYFMPSDQRGYLLDLEHVKWHPFGKGTYTEDLAPDGSGERKMLKATHLWHPGDPRAHIAIKPSSETATSFQG